MAGRFPLICELILDYVSLSSFNSFHKLLRGIFSAPSMRLCNNSCHVALDLLLCAEEGPRDLSDIIPNLHKYPPDRGFIILFVFLFCFLFFRFLSFLGEFIINPIL